MEMSRHRVPSHSAHRTGSISAKLLTPLLVPALGFFFLYDYYLPDGGLRPFDVAGFLLLLLVTGPQIMLAVASGLRIRLPHLPVVLFALFFVIGALRGISAGNFRPSLAILAGFYVFWMYYAIPIDREAMLKVVKVMLWVQVTSLVAQLLTYALTGVVLTFRPFLEWEAPRTHNIVLGLFRPAGLFLEPNNYSLAMFMLLALWHRLGGPWGLLSYAALGGMVVSESLWGVGIAVLLIWMFAFGWLLRIAGILVALLIPRPELINSLTFLGVSDITIGRLLNLESDPSALGRYSVVLGQGPGESGFSWFGFGVSAADFQAYAGANGISYFLYAFGIVGLLLYLAAYGGLAHRRFKLLAVLCMLLAMTAFPLWSYFFWWAWIALLARRYPSEETESRSALVPVTLRGSSSVRQT